MSKEGGIPCSNIMLTSRDEFLVYLNCNLKMLLNRYVPLGLPGIVVNGRWSGSTEQIDRWWNDLHRAPIQQTIKNGIRIGDGEDFE
jgi:hypothetical protein